MVKKRHVIVLLSVILLVIAIMLLMNQLFLPELSEQEPEPPLIIAPQLILPLAPPPLPALTKVKPDSSVQLKEKSVSAYKLWTAAELAGKSVGHRFYKIGNKGEILTGTSTAWNCVYDDLTGFLWEVKTADGSWQDHEHTYTWFQPSPQEIETLSLVAGSDATELPFTAERGKADGGKCYDVYCDTYHYAQAFNQSEACGSVNWRLPYAHELGYLDHKENYYPDIDTRYFPHTAVAYYWSRTETPKISSLAWAINFKEGFPYISEKRIPYRIRLVADA
ncbi:MAG: hypothetical protein ACI8VC_002760 [Candidatus Endobugula sp.]|jgi:hypothetical protein